MNVSRSHRIIFRISLAAALIGITILAVTPLSYPVVSGVNDKFNHVLAFFVLALLTNFSFPEKEFAAAMILSLIGYGLAIEITQYFLPHRMFSLLDLVTDGAGIGLYKAFRPLLKKVWMEFLTKTES